MSVNSSDLIFDLSCLQGQIADVGIALQGLETQRLLNPTLYEIGGNGKDEKKYIHDLKSFLNFVSSSSNNKKLNQSLSTFYISEFLYNAMLTLNKFVNEVTYSTSCEIVGPTGGVRPFNKTFSQDLYRLIKKKGLIKTELDSQDDGYGQPIINFDTIVTNSFEIENREDLLKQGKFIIFDEIGMYNKEILESVYTDSYQVVIPKSFLTSADEFGNNMRKLITDLYKEYYYYEIVDIQKRLNRTDSASVTNLDTNLRIMLQEVHNAFTREIYSPVTDISTEFPLSNIITELNDFINDLDGTDISKYNNLELFDDSSDSMKLSLYAFIEEKSHMLNRTGNAYHYALEMAKRIQRISNYMNNESDSIDYPLGPNPHFDGKLAFTEDVCIQGIDEGLAILSNLTNDLDLLTSDNTKHNLSIKNDSFNISLTNIEDIYHKYVTLASDNSNEIFHDEDIKGVILNSAQLNSLGIVDVLKNADLFHFGRQDENKTVDAQDFLYNGKQEKYVNKYCNNFITQTYYKNTKVARYENKYLYRTFSLIVIKIAISLTVLYIFRIIQAYNKCKIENKTHNLRSTKNNEIERLLSRKIPNDLTITDYTTVTHLRKELEKMKMQLRSGTKENSFVFELPKTTEATVNKKGIIQLEDPLKNCYETIIGFMDNQADDGNKLTNSNFISDTFARLYPFTKSMLYQYDDYFSVGKLSDYNKDNNTSLEIKFGTILNGLNYVAQSVTRTQCEDYKVADLEKTLTKIIYLCTCLTVNWSDQDIITTTSIDTIRPKECPLSDLMTFDHVDIHGLFDRKTIEISKSSNIQGTYSTFKITLLGFIHGEMETVVNSDLPWVVKYVYWLSLYCINSYFIHLMKKDITQVITKVESKE